MEKEGNEKKMNWSRWFHYQSLVQQVKELKYEYKMIKGELLSRSKQSELVKAVTPLGLQELTVSPVVLIDSLPQQ
jgi:hypothetical protein